MHSFLSRIKVSFSFWDLFLDPCITSLPGSPHFPLSPPQPYCFALSKLECLLQSSGILRYHGFNFIFRNLERAWERHIFHDLSSGTVITQPWAHKSETYTFESWMKFCTALPQNTSSPTGRWPSFLLPHLEACPFFGVIFNLYAFLEGIVMYFLPIWKLRSITLRWVRWWDSS